MKTRQILGWEKHFCRLVFTHFALSASKPEHVSLLYLVALKYPTFSSKNQPLQASPFSVKNPRHYNVTHRNVTMQNNGIEKVMTDVSDTVSHVFSAWLNTVEVFFKC